MLLLFGEDYAVGQLPDVLLDEILLRVVNIPHILSRLAHDILIDDLDDSILVRGRELELESIVTRRDEQLAWRYGQSNMRVPICET